METLNKGIVNQKFKLDSENDLCNWAIDTFFAVMLLYHIFCLIIAMNKTNSFSTKFYGVNHSSYVKFYISYSH